MGPGKDSRLLEDHDMHFTESFERCQMRDFELEVEISTHYRRWVKFMEIDAEDARVKTCEDFFRELCKKICEDARVVSEG